MLPARDAADVRLTRYVRVLGTILALLCTVPLANRVRPWSLIGTGVAVPIEAGMLLVCAIGLLAGASRRFLVQTAIGAGLLALTLPSLPSLPGISGLGVAAAAAPGSAWALGVSSGSAAAFLIIGLSFLAAALPRLGATVGGMAGLSLASLASFVVVERLFGPHHGTATEIISGMPAFGPVGALICAAGLLLLGWRDGDRCGGLPRWLPHASATGVYSAAMLLGATLMATYPGESGPLVFATTLTLGCALAVLTGICVRLMQLARERASQSDAAAEALAASEERLKLALGNARHGLWDWNLTSDTVILDDNWWSILGYRRGEMPDSLASWRETMHPDDRTHVTEALKSSLKSDDALFDVEYRALRKDGQWIWINTRGRVQSRAGDFTAIRMMGTIHDISERKRAQQILQEQEQRFRQIVNGASDIIYRTDDNGHFNFVNAAAERVLQMDARTLLGRHYLTLIRDDLRGAAQEFYAEQAAQQRANSYSEFPVITGSGEEIWLGQNVQVLADERGIIGFQGLARDITERKRMERALQDAHDRALDSARLKSEFLANMSHEIRTPMNGVIGLASLLQDTPLSPTQQAYVDGIRTSGDALLTVINDVLDSSKIEAGMLHIESIDFELHSMVESTLQMFAEPARRKQLGLSAVIDEDVPATVCGDPNRLRQVLTNLIGNAVKFTTEGSVGIRVSNMPRRGDLASIRFEVHDTGIGMTEDVLSRVFQPFVQADSSTTRRFGGTGLGLAISKRLVELMGGIIDVRSQVGLGSTFWFAVPLHTAAEVIHDDRPILEAHTAGYEATSLPVWSDAPVPQPVAHAVPANGARILVVEDNRVNQAVARGMLEGLGYSVDLAGDGIEALEAIDRRSYDAVLMDCQMPRMDGFTATAEIRRRESSAARIPIIALTAYATEGERERCLDAGMDDYLSKPVTKPDLARVLARWTTGTDAVAVAAPSRTTREDQAIDLDRLAGVRDEMGDEGVNELVDMLLTDVAGSSAAFRKLADAGEFAEVARQAHRLKGSCRVLGFDQLARIYDELELLPEDASLERIHSESDRLNDLLLAVRALFANSQFPIPNSQPLRPATK
jgi:PAS domain S-box-containing protein